MFGSMEEIKVAKEKIEMLLQLFQVDPINLEGSLLLNNQTGGGNLTVLNHNHLDFDFFQVRTLIKQVETGLNIL